MWQVALLDARGTLLWLSQRGTHAAQPPQPVLELVDSADQPRVLESLTRVLLGRAEEFELSGPLSGNRQLYRVRCYPVRGCGEVAVCASYRMLDERLKKLSPREREVMARLPHYGPSEIARQLGVSKSTVETHRANLRSKLLVDGLGLMRLAVANYGD